MDKKILREAFMHGWMLAIKSAAEHCNQYIEEYADDYIEFLEKQDKKINQKLKENK